MVHEVPQTMKDELSYFVNWFMIMRFKDQLSLIYAGGRTLRPAKCKEGRFPFSGKLPSSLLLAAARQGQQNRRGEDIAKTIERMHPL